MLRFGNIQCFMIFCVFELVAMDIFSNEVHESYRGLGTAINAFEILEKYQKMAEILSFYRKKIKLFDNLLILKS